MWDRQSSRWDVDRKSCEDEIKRYPDESRMPDNHNFRIMMRDAT